MLATFVIGLREGLEAALIVGIIAAFLRTNGRRLTAMWVGVALALALSLAVGIALAAVEQSLPQAAQEGMETIIGIVAVFFVTSMLVWMQRHARGMRAELEEQAGEALKDGHALALAGMAFLAVLKEGFETSVFLLATFSASTNTGLAVVGAALGILAAVAVGIGIYAGGVRLDLGRFFRITGAFLILVAAGLVVSVLRTAHEAGWLNAGQQQVLDLSWLVRPGSVASALITGVLGIPADPRLIEVIGWVAYLAPVALIVYWPPRLRPHRRTVAILQLSLAGAAGVAAIGLAVGMSVASVPAASTSTVVGADDTTPVGTARLVHAELTIAVPGVDPGPQVLSPGDAREDSHDGVSALRWETTTTTTPRDAPTRLTLDDLAALSGGRLPIGIDRARQPGPFDTTWDLARVRTVWTAGDTLLDAQESDRVVATLSGGGLTTPRTVTLTATDPAHVSGAGWRIAPDDVTRAAATAAAAGAVQDERLLWGVQLPVVLGAIALILLAYGLRSVRRSRPVEDDAAPTPLSPHASEQTRRSSIHASS